MITLKVNSTKLTITQQASNTSFVSSPVTEIPSSILPTTTINYLALSTTSNFYNQSAITNASLIDQPVLENILQFFFQSDDQDMIGCLANCSNNGECQFYLNTFKLFCSCNLHFRGPKCDIDTRACSCGPCLNNAVCINTNLSTTGYLCNCNQFYTGTNCETEIDLCQNETCSSNGKCGIVDNKPKCKCFRYYSGETCELQEKTLSTIKYVSNLALILTISLISLFYILIFVSDLLNYVICRSKYRYRKPKILKKFKRLKNIK